MEDVVMAEMGVPTTASATTITTATTTTTALLLLRLLLETRRFPAFASKWRTLNPCLPCPPPLLYPPFLNPSLHSSRPPHPLLPWLPPLNHLCTCVDTHCSHRLICLAFLHTLGVDSKRKASATPRTPKLLSPPLSSSCARFTSHSEA